MADLTAIKKIEQGRAEFAFKCAEQGKKILNEKGEEIDGEWYKDSNYKSYVKKVPVLIKTNGLGPTVTFIYSKRKKIDGKEIAPGKKENPKNAYDLIYKQVTKWLESEPKGLLAAELKRANRELARVVVSIDSALYRAVTVEVLALFNWLKRFAEGLIESEAEE